jgi:hypothetical protein
MKYYQGHKMKKDEMSVAYGTYGGEENTYRLLAGKI